MDIRGTGPDRLTGFIKPRTLHGFPVPSCSTVLPLLPLCSVEWLQQSALPVPRGQSGGVAQVCTVLQAGAVALNGKLTVSGQCLVFAPSPLPGSP